MLLQPTAAHIGLLTSVQICTKQCLESVKNSDVHDKKWIQTVLEQFDIVCGWRFDRRRFGRSQFTPRNRFANI